MYKVINSLSVEGNTAVTIQGLGMEFKNGIRISDADGNSYRLISVALMSGINPAEIGKTTTLFIEGEFQSDELFV